MKNVSRGATMQEHAGKTGTHMTGKMLTETMAGARH